MADQDLSTLDENKPNGDTEEVAVLDEYQRETRTKLKAWAGVEHDLATGAHIIPSGGAIAPGIDGRIRYHDVARELIVDQGGAWRSTAQPSFNYVINGMFNQFYTNPVNTFVGWGISGTGALLLKPSTTSMYGPDVARIRAVTDYALLFQIVAYTGSNNSPFSPINYWRNKTITFGVFMLTGTPNCGFIRIFNGSTYSAAVHPGDSQWHWITTTMVVPFDATMIQLEIVSQVVNPNVTVSGATLVEGHSCPHPLPPGWQGRQGVVHVGSPNVQPNTNTPWWYSPGGNTLAQYSSQFFVPFDAYVKHLRCQFGVDPGAGTYTAQVDWAGNLTPLVVTLTGTGIFGANLVNSYFGQKGGGWAVKVTRNGGVANLFCGSFLYDEVPQMY